jgi:hypothetical protein
LSDSLLGTGPGKRESFVYFNDQSFGGIRVKNYKTLYTAKDTWLGQDQNLKIPALYDLWWDPGEQYDIVFNGAAPTRGDLKTSPGRAGSVSTSPRSSGRAPKSSRWTARAATGRPHFFSAAITPRVRDFARRRAIGDGSDKMPTLWVQFEGPIQHQSPFQSGCLYRPHIPNLPPN